MKKQLTLGDQAPEINETDLWDKQIRIPSQTGKWTYISFHRFADCPFCNLRTNQLIQQYELFRQHQIEVVSILPSSKEKLLKNNESNKTPFLMLSDASKNIYRRYGVTESSLLGAFRLLSKPKQALKAFANKHKNITVDADPKLLPASFLVNPEGILQMVYYGKHYGDHPEIDIVVQSRKQLL